MASPRPSLRRAPRRASTLDIVTNLFAIGIVLVVGFLAWPFLIAQFKERIGITPAQVAPTARAGNVGGQAPPSVRGTNPDPAPAQAVATPIPGLAQNEATAQAMYNAAVEKGNEGAAPAEAAPTPVLAPLPLNSAGEPVIDQRQQQQLNQSAELAALEAAAAQRAAQLADAESRAPDVSYEEAKELLGRDPCHVPRADPATCARGLFKPTPIGGE